MRPIGPPDTSHSECVLIVGVSRPKLAALFLSVMLLSLFLTFHILYDSAVYSIQVSESLFDSFPFPVSCALCTTDHGEVVSLKVAVWDGLSVIYWKSCIEFSIARFIKLNVVRIFAWKFIRKMLFLRDECVRYVKFALLWEIAQKKNQWIFYAICPLQMAKYA